MNKYRKKPFVIKAVQLSDNNIEEVAKWCDGIIVHDLLKKMVRGIEIPTLEGDMLATIGDYIIKGIKGEFYPCKPDIFEASYEIEV
jgi:hypothetical protein